MFFSLVKLFLAGFGFPKFQFGFITLQVTGTCCNEHPLRKQVYSNILKILPPKNECFLLKILIFFLFLLKT